MRTVVRDRGDGGRVFYALNQDSMRRAEGLAATRFDLTLEELMSRAGRAVANEVMTHVPFGTVAVVVGRGNNGGDGWVAARVLHMAGRSVRVYTPSAPSDLGGIAEQAALAAESAGVPFTVEADVPAPDALRGNAAVVDALFGIGFTGTVRAPYDAWLDAINGSGGFVIAADVPSGVDADTGRTDEHAVRASLTVTFSAPKPGLLLYPGAGHAGDVIVADLGIPSEALGDSGDLEVWSRVDYAAALPQPTADSHKNMMGRVLVIAGSGAFTGAAVLTVMGAQRMGAGYVTLACPESVAPIAQSKLTSAVVIGLAENPSRTLASKAADGIIDLAKEYDAVVVGPGLTVAHGAVLLVRTVVAELEKPLVLDADGLNAMVDSLDTLRARTAPLLLTPHPGELGRMLGVTPAEVQSDRLKYGSSLAGLRTACALKGARTVVSGRGRQVVNLSGGPALATAGTGDVLAGMAGALLAQGLEPLEAGALAAWLHGRAGDHAGAALTSTCVVAEDLPEYLPRAVGELLGTE